MSRFLYNVDASIPLRLLELERAAGGPLSETAAVVDLLLAIDSGRILGQRIYAERWGWTYPAVRYRWADLTAEAARLATADGRQADGPLASKIPAAWMKAAGLTGRNSAEKPRDATVSADPQRTRTRDAGQQRTQQRSNSAPSSAENRPDDAENGDSQRTQQRTYSAPSSAAVQHPSSYIPHPNSSSTRETPDGAETADPSAAPAAAVDNSFDAVQMLTSAGVDEPVAASLAAQHPAADIRLAVEQWGAEKGKSVGFLVKGLRAGWLPREAFRTAPAAPDAPRLGRPAIGTSRTPDEAAALDAAGLTAPADWQDAHADGRLYFRPLAPHLPPALPRPAPSTESRGGPPAPLGSHFAALIPTSQ